MKGTKTIFEGKSNYFKKREKKKNISLAFKNIVKIVVFVHFIYVEKKKKTKKKRSEANRAYVDGEICWYVAELEVGSGRRRNQWQALIYKSHKQWPVLSSSGSLPSLLSPQLYTSSNPSLLFSSLLTTPCLFLSSIPPR